MSDPLILHYAPDNASLCVRLALAELNLPYQTQLVDRRAGGTKTPAYRALNPNGLIPTLETPDGPLFETAAILLWLADQHPGTIFPAASDPKRGAALTRLLWLANTVHPALRMIFYPKKYAAGAEDLLRAQTHTRLNALWDQMNGDTAHLTTDKPCIIACYLAPMLRWCALYGGDTSWFDLTRWPALATFAQTFETRDSASHVAALEGLGGTPFSQPSPPNPPEGHAH